MEDKDLLDELNAKLAKCEDELAEYKSKTIPKFNLHDKLFSLDIKNEKLEQFKVDEISIGRFGVFYVEFMSEKEVRYFPEAYCFDDEQEANDALLKSIDKKENVVE